MSVVLEVSVAAEAFQLGEVLAAPDAMRIELERVVPVGTDSPLYLWATGPERERFERDVRADDRVDAFSGLDRQEDRTLYRLEWNCEAPAIVDAIRRTEAVVVRARMDDQWLFRLRFPDDERLSRFHDQCVAGEVPVCIERIDRSSDYPDADQSHRLSDAQREALLVALERGYFATPSEVSLQELAVEFDISHQALSSRIRRGLEVLLSDTLLGPCSEEV